MTPVDRNGIPILDPPGQNKLRPSPCRTPEDHDYGPPVRGRVEVDWIMGTEGTEYVQTCRRCGVRDSYWKTYDPYARNP